MHGSGGCVVPRSRQRSVGGIVQQKKSHGIDQIEFKKRKHRKAECEDLEHMDLALWQVASEPTLYGRWLLASVLDSKGKKCSCDAGIEEKENSHEGEQQAWQRARRPGAS
eukprot:TRINITY_DN38545_c0_g1_i1.p3 TRINITY_DN38545_c0_g1~~TRINITY_DN38545_c0_g1_i1.p3  ORF type:complete len:110 (-),score=22.44 TRINITY_DN38545_c0_g1_i1:237-566(-)